jgi:hypothetical protein
MMKCVKIALVIVLVGAIDSCSLLQPETVYYYVWSSSPACASHGYVKYKIPDGFYENTDTSLTYVASKAFKFKVGDMLTLSVGINEHSISSCYGTDITATIMKGGQEGAYGSGGTVAATFHAENSAGAIHPVL